MSRVLRVVVADDDDPVRELVAVWLEQLGHAVTPVRGGEELVEACRAAPPDLVVSDVRMPGTDGLSAAAVVRAEFGLPVVLMSGAWSAEQEARADALRVTRLQKPVRPLELVRAVDEAVRVGDGR